MDPREKMKVEAMYTGWIPEPGNLLQTTRKTVRVRGFYAYTSVYPHEYTTDYLLGAQIVETGQSLGDIEIEFDKIIEPPLFSTACEALLEAAKEIASNPDWLKDLPEIEKEAVKQMLASCAGLSAVTNTIARQLKKGVKPEDYVHATTD